MNDVLTQIANILDLIVGVLALLATIEIFHISATLKKILAAVKTADVRRREEFDAMTQGDQDARI